MTEIVDGGANVPAAHSPGMMGQFLVVEPGQQADLMRPEGDSDDHRDH